MRRKKGFVRRTGIFKKQSKYKTKNKSRFNVYKTLSILLILVFFGFIPGFIKRLIVINKIVCSSQYGDCSEEIIKGTDYLLGSRLKFAKLGLEEYFTNNYLIQDYVIQYKIPSSLKVDIVLKKPKYSIFSNSENLYYLIDKDGVVLKKDKSSNLPTVLTYNTIFMEGDTVDSETLKACEIVFNLDWLYSIKQGEIKDNSLFIKLEEGPVVRFPLTGDVEALVGSLRLIYSRLNEIDNGIRIENTKEIDLRFKNPVIR